MAREFAVGDSGAVVPATKRQRFVAVERLEQIRCVDNSSVAERAADRAEQHDARPNVFSVVRRRETPRRINRSSRPGPTRELGNGEQRLPAIECARRELGDVLGLDAEKPRDRASRPSLPAIMQCLRLGLDSTPAPADRSLDALAREQTLNADDDRAVAERVGPERGVNAAERLRPVDREVVNRELRADASRHGRTAAIATIEDRRQRFNTLA